MHIIEVIKIYKKQGAVIMGIDFNSTKELIKIFDEYTQSDNKSFIKTKVPIKLMRNEGMELISRSQARRLASGFEKFAHVTQNLAESP